MARIRTIKPEFWTSEQVMECSRDARLLFVGIWNFADDEGRMPFSAKRLKAQILPADDISSENVRRWVAELEAHGLVIVYQIDSKEFLQVTGWHHQKIDKPNSSKWHPPPDFKPVTIRRTVVERSPPESGLRKGVRKRNLEREKHLGAERESRRERTHTQPGTRARARGAPQNGGAGVCVGSPPSGDWPADWREQFVQLWPGVAARSGLKGLEAKRREGKLSWRFLLTAIVDYETNRPPHQAPMKASTFVEGERWNDPAPRPNGKHEPTSAERAAQRAFELEADERASVARGAPDAIGGDEIGGDDARQISGHKRS
jgi:hypothetical protein